MGRKFLLSLALGGTRMVFSVATGPEPCESQTCMDRLIPHSVYCVSWFVLQTELGNVSFVSLELKALLKDQ
jgi:hypothetical protein